jgi:hypothetical protein
VLALPDSGLTPLLEAALPTSDPENVTARVEAAVIKYRRHRASLSDRRDAIRDLADVLEYWAYPGFVDGLVVGSGGASRLTLLELHG